MNEYLEPKDFVITRKRKKYKFALFHNSPLCFELDGWHDQPVPDVLEVGAGTGLFGVALAAELPKKRILAVDVKADRLQTGARKAAEEGLTNIQFLRARAGQLGEVIAPHSLEMIWVTFPDPFPKDRSSKHRLTHPNFLSLYASLLGSDGALYFKTDARALFTWSLEQLVNEGWAILELSFDLHESDLSDLYKQKTTYETRFTAEGLPTHFVKAMPPRQ
ncbi:tRNA (guanosine(46)-N7)-methyltransferase TrmB [Streptomyces caniscabiei]|uniref:tRNA (guanosine(46)-N7)-methyltransferase TrmB n=1 Tax=Streptomyces caniscabiei TaxID=2746961 RepID=UPI0029BF1A2A|nr:tRNA (guanosine(46)-N7)-methyltransferase TrmB [Streptomyces caniscabiei]MDX2776477.1 tRNA (guanosine(46)-N7)-methyltransferase TrmB [Streptomyces caniscabiei]